MTVPPPTAHPPISVLDLAPIVEGSDAAAAFRNSLDLAQHAERWGYNRFWLAEHHGMSGIASAATSIIISHVAAGTTTIRVGAGGIMLPNHSPLVIAEQFGTLASLHPGRIDLGLGRAPGSDAATARALRRDPMAADTFPQDVAELMDYFRPADPGRPVRAVPGEGLDVPVWILGSSLFGASLAAAYGLPFAFAGHFAPRLMMEALTVYRSGFRPSERLEEPYAMVGVMVIGADTDEEARLLFTSIQQAFVALRRGAPTQLQPPRPGYERTLTPFERQGLVETLSEAIVGGPDTVRHGLSNLLDRTGADEVIIATQVYDHAARLHSFRLVSEISGLA